MSEITLSMDDKMERSVAGLMQQFGAKTKAELISKAIAVLKIVAYVEETHGELIAKKDGKETKIRVG